MKRMSTLMLALSLAASGTALAAPQDHHDHGHDDRNEQHHDDHRDDHRPPPRHDQGPHHHARGERLVDGHRGTRVDYHRYHLSAPPRGHEWRRVDNDYVLVAVATGIITSVIAASQ